MGQTLSVDAGGQVSSSVIYVGEFASGTLRVEAGGQVSSDGGYIGWDTRSLGMVTVSGAASEWTNHVELHIGVGGNGTLKVEAGGQVSSENGFLGGSPNSAGTAIVSGAGSRWTNGSDLRVGFGGSGVLTIADDGEVTATTLSINNASGVRLHVSGDDMLVLGGNVINNGTIAFYADASLPAGVYRPISDYAGDTMVFLGTGSYKAFGGTWDTISKTFTVAEPTSLSAGASVTVTTGERLLFTDIARGERAGASFGTMTGSVSFSAAPMGAADRAALAGLLDEGDGVLAAWAFATTFSGGEVMLSFDIGADAEGLSIWRLSNDVWSAYTPDLLTYDSAGRASFTVSSFGAYAITAAVPQWQGNDPAAPNLWATAVNWSSQVQPGRGGQALFTQATANKNVDLGGGTCTAGLVRLASSEGYTIHNGTLAIDNGGKLGGGIRLEGGGNGSHTISAAVRIVDDATITIDSGKLNLSGGASITGGKTLSVEKAVADSLQISAITGGTGTLSLGAQTVTKLSGDSSIGELVMEASAKLDLSADLVVAAGSLEEINGLVAKGRADGSWDGLGIMSSTLASEGGNRTLAVLAEGDGVKVVQTWAGDLTGDGVVDGADYLVLDRNWLADPGTLLYADGNIDYSADGITGDDFFQMDRAYMGQSMTSGSAGAPGSMAAAVPEPGMMGLVVLAGLMLGRRARGQ